MGTSGTRPRSRRVYYLEVFQLWHNIHLRNNFSVYNFFHFVRNRYDLRIIKHIQESWKVNCGIIGLILTGENKRQQITLFWRTVRCRILFSRVIQTLLKDDGKNWGLESWPGKGFQDFCNNLSVKVFSRQTLQYASNGEITRNDNEIREQLLPRGTKYEGAIRLCWFRSALFTYQISKKHIQL